MFAGILQRVEGMSFAERITYIQDLIARPDRSWAADECGRLMLFLVHAHLNQGETSQVVSIVDREIAGDLPPTYKARLLEYRAQVEVDLGDVPGALATLAEMELHGIPVEGKPRYHYLMARCLTFRHSPDAFVWYRRAVDAYVSAGESQAAAVPATWAALTAVDTGDSPDEWLHWIPEEDPYRLAIMADWSLASGSVEDAARFAGAALDAAGTQGRRSYAEHAQARASLVLAKIAADAHPERSMLLAEQALSLALCQPAGYEPCLVEKILSFRKA